MRRLQRVRWNGSNRYNMRRELKGKGKLMRVIRFLSLCKRMKS